MTELCGRCGMMIREGEQHPERVCLLVQAAREVRDTAREDPEGHLVPGSSFERLCRALDGANALNASDLKTIPDSGLDLVNGEWEEVRASPVPGTAVADEPSTPKLRVVPGGPDHNLLQHRRQ